MIKPKKSRQPIVDSRYLAALDRQRSNAQKAPMRLLHRLLFAGLFVILLLLAFFMS